MVLNGSRRGENESENPHTRREGGGFRPVFLLEGARPHWCGPGAGPTWSRGGGGLPSPGSLSLSLSLSSTHPVLGLRESSVAGEGGSPPTTKL